MATELPKSVKLPKFKKLGTKLLVSFLVIGILPVIAIGWYSFKNSESQLLDIVAQQVQDAAVTDGDMIDRNLFERYGDVQAFAANPHALGSDEEAQAIVDFLTANYGVYDAMMIVGLDGVVKTSNSIDGSGNPIDDSRIVGRDVSNEEWFKTISSGNTPSGGTYYTDAHFGDIVTTLYGSQILTLPFSAPIFDGNGEMAAIWHNEASFARVVTDIMDQRQASFTDVGVASTEVQVIRQDGLLLNDADPAAILSFNLRDAGLQAAVLATGSAGNSGYTLENHARTGIAQINGWAVTDGALGFEGYDWGILVRQEKGEATAAAGEMRNSLYMFGIVAILLTAVAALWLARGISGPLKRSVAKLSDVAKGDLGVTFDAESEDEIGQMGSALNEALESIGETLAQVDHSATDLTVSATELTDVSREMSTSATATSDQANSVSAAAEEIATSSESVAKAMDQMSASVREISDNTADAARMTSKAVEVSSTTRERMEKLDASATDIGNVINVITSIAAQTDLLALNATIEAARVGEAGKGFAVVANEVKTLAQQTSSATEEIQAKIETIQSDAVGAVSAIVEISELIEKVNETSTAIAGAVEEQSATTAEVSSTIQAVTDGTSEISRNIGAVATAAGTARAGAGSAQDAAVHLSGLANRLSGLLTEFTLSQEQLLAANATRSESDTSAPAPVEAPTGGSSQQDSFEAEYTPASDEVLPRGWS